MAISKEILACAKTLGYQAAKDNTSPAPALNKDCMNLVLVASRDNPEMGATLPILKAFRDGYAQQTREAFARVFATEQATPEQFDLKLS